MPYTFTFGDIARVCQALGMRRDGKGQVWKGLGRDGVFHRLALHSHGPGEPIAPGTAKAICKRLGFESLEAMYLFLKGLK